MARQVEDSDFELLTKIKTLGLSADQIAARVARADELEHLATARAHATAAGLHGDVLAPLLTSFGLETATRQVHVEEHGRRTTREVPHVRKRGDQNAAWTPLRAYVEQDGSPLKPYASSLIAGPAPAGDATSTSTSQPSSAVDKVLDARKAGAAVKNPLMGATST